MGPDEPILVAGGTTLIGAALLRLLEREGYTAVFHDEGLDLSDAAAADALLARTRPRHLFLVAGRTAGIRGNQLYPADLMLDNLAVGLNVVVGARRHGVRKLLYLASSCSYPRQCPQPMREDALLSGPLEPTNEAYAMAKLATFKLCQAMASQYRARFITGIPANCFGPGDHFDEDNAHVVGALIRRMHRARLRGEPEVVVWGTGRARREFIYVDDVARACLFVMQRYEGAEPINLGGGTDVSIRELAELIREVVGYTGRLVFDPDRPDGMPLKALDASRLLSLGFAPAHRLEPALEATYRWYVESYDADH